MRTVHVLRGPAEKTPVQVKDDAHLAELVQRFGQESVIDADTGQPAQPEGGAGVAPEPKAPKARSKAKPAGKTGSKKRSKR